MLIHGWGRYPATDAAIVTPRTYSAASNLLSTIKEGDTVIARGLGRSYGDSALARQVVSALGLNTLLDFNEQAGIVSCGAGVTLEALLEIFLPKGWFLPVTPGTKFVTLGGAIASDVHGKNHHRDGCFSDHIDSLKLLIANGEIVTCSKTERPELFRATCGGMGLTGIILETTFRLRRVASAFIEQTTLKAGCLEEALTLLDQHQTSTYSVAWIDCLAAGSELGRCLIMLGEHASDGGLSVPARSALTVPVEIPFQLLSHRSVAVFNALYYHQFRGVEKTRRVTFDQFFYPLDRIHHWNRLYGKKGFVQYQFVLPKESGLEGMRTILRKIVASRRGSFLAVLKVCGKSNDNFLSFPMEGFTLALDFRLESGLFELLEELDIMVLDLGGRIYLAKDARMSLRTFRLGYPKWQMLQEVRAQVKAGKKFSSDQSRRLGLD